MIIKSYSQLHEWVAITQKTQSMLKIIDNKSDNDNSIKTFNTKNTVPQFRYQGKNTDNNSKNNLGAIPKQNSQSYKQSNDQNRQFNPLNKQFNNKPNSQYNQPSNQFNNQPHRQIQNQSQNQTTSNPVKSKTV